MKKNYYFALKLEPNKGDPYLNIKPVAFRKTLIPYPVNFRELNVPIKINKSSVSDASELEYFLDFEKGFNGEGEHINSFSREKLIKVLSDLEKTIDEKLREALYMKSKLNMKVKITSDNGLEINNKRVGNPNYSKSPDGPIKRKKLSS